ncbi:MAG: hypothetical protein E7404_00940 [Ruminococcaceae bacterium]|nr:hypothetical protein [Oscillospiraceae bacterium]
MKIASKDATKLITILIVSKILFSDINIFVKGSMSASYLEAIMCALVSIAFFLIISCFFKKSKCADIFEAIEFSFGRKIKIFAGTLFLILILSYTALILKLYTDAILTIAYPNSPAFFVMFFIMLTMVFSAYAGIGTITKFSSVCVSVMLTLLAILYILASKNIDITNIFPVLGNGAGNILMGAKNIFMYNEILFLFFISGFLEKREDAPKIGLKALIYSSVIIVVSTLFYTLCIPYPASKLFNMPLLQLASSTDVSFFLQRSEGIFFLLWIFSSFLYLGATFYFSLYTFKRTFDSSDIKALIPSFIVTVFSSTWFFKNTKIIENYYIIFTSLFVIFSFLVPLIAYIFENIKRRRKNV